ncbi:LSM domain-containing protein [Haloquadratum walsbyi]|jgi:Small nuclear ribonucleoprotein, LSM family|uniref:Small nuclear ribonucleoprotein, LSM family n=1 Tax=Haloquadratum walsbyi J07HQW2 TaxID=1238425 RepID=U1PMY3_9EURY|nr:LSM domain-containing protein [Haloquadratum walsbyi]ERG95102.1 MAG: small nuclear ribonucleoprotein, LSM family [Haloquadratum walsbyi J07HQW2]
MSGRPLDVLEAALDNTVTITLKDGSAYYGTLAGYDQHMNAVLDPIGASENTDPGALDVTTVEDTTIIRGDNIVTINT